jgi:Flagellar hook-length control protein
MLGAGVVAQGNTADTVPVEAKQAQARTPLHESILAQVKEGVVTHDGKGNGQMSIRLNPGELGELKIQVRMENNRLNVEVQADNRMVKDLLLGNLDSLKEALSGKNLTMDGFNVSTGGGGFNGPLNEERGNQKQQQPQRFARGAGYDGQDAPRVNYLTAEVNSLLDVRF